MTETEKKALALVNEACKSDFKDLGSTYRNNLLDALLRAIEQHEAYKQEVSDALSVYQKADGLAERSLTWDALTRFIIPKHDPLVEALKQLKMSYVDAEDFRAALAARGLEIREKQP